MKWTKRLTDHFNILNILLIAAAVALFIWLDYPLLNPETKIIRPRAKAAAVAGAEKAAPASAVAYMDYAVVAEKNLFHPDRKVPAEKKDDKLPVRPEIVLYGTMIAGDKKLAYIEDKKAPYSTPGRGRRQVTIPEGGMISGFKLSEVHEDHIVLTRGEDKMLVRLNDGKVRAPGQTQTGVMAAPSTGQKMPFPERKSGSAAAQQIQPAHQQPATSAQPAVQPPAPARPKLTIPQRREGRPLHRPNPLEYNQ
ncbi:MAG: hypothetical protein EG826_00920 [Deltaproteobacteria bacterium]|nr:hypothetical protein [Deltaproteobacteria bacterium]